MSTYILGISAFYHDSAAALIVEGRIVAAAQEERFTRIKHDASFPQHAVDYCLREGGISAADLDHVVFYEKPLRRFERLLETYLGVAPLGFSSFLRAMPTWIHQKLQLPREMNKRLGGEYTKQYVFTEHHEAHAASAFYPSPFADAAILTIDGVGEWATASVGYGRGHQIELKKELHFPHSLGLFYSAFTTYCGFKVNSGEYKLMGLAPYGIPRFQKVILEQMIDLRDDGSFRLDQSFFNYCQGLTMTSPKFHDLFGGPPRTPDSALTNREMDLAASVQKVTELIMLRMARHAYDLTGSKNLCLAGGVALNCVSNGRLLRDSPFENIWVQPAAGDAGGALGGGLFVWHQLLENEREVVLPDAQEGSLLGPTPDEIESVLSAGSAVYTKIENETKLCSKIAQQLAEGEIVGWVQGRMEFGPRALGSRSILADPRRSTMQRDLNLKIKFRESFRPFAPIVIRERANDFFDLLAGQESPYMLIVAPVAESQRIPPGKGEMTGLDSVNELRSSIPAVTHVDNSARVQTVDRTRSPRLRALLEAFETETGCPVLINTSFNIRGEPIVCSIADAYRCFMATEMDVLVIDNFVLFKTDQPIRIPAEKNQYLARYGDD